MTFVTHDTAISLYPLATFGLELNFAKYDQRPPARQGRVKYQGQGWTTAGPECVYPDAVMRSVEHHVGDRFCWTVPLVDNSMNGIVPAIHAHSWTLVYPSPEAGWINQYAILSLPGPKPGICVSRSIITHFKLDMAKWTQGYFAEFVHDLLEKAYVKKYNEIQPL
ncbi:uncharacterized protein ARMOST_20955 [Armillaria ostoyae]|uniref:Uncharacterized protein n=1 Tax=Armillaria ostoyae TaxID=47428 RepID=A0A284S8R0_ARMOS|nr:uncharacterized protein ARMOST_20955 [Armillaria ostoyae]